MASKNRPHREQKKKPKGAVKPKLQSYLDVPPPAVEVIKPKRKPREEPEETTTEDEA